MLKHICAEEIYLILRDRKKSSRIGSALTNAIDLVRRCCQAAHSISASAAINHASAKRMIGLPGTEKHSRWPAAAMANAEISGMGY